MAINVEQKKQTPHHEETWQLRAFGQSNEDLNINFYQSLRPQLITDVLLSCTLLSNGDDDWQHALWQLPVSKRLQALIKVAFASGLDQLSCTLNCKKENCKELFDISFTEPELLSGFPDYHQETFEVNLDKQQLILTRPTGQHQRQWMTQHYVDGTSAELDMIKTLIINHKQSSTIREVDLKRFNQAMDDFDPMINFTVKVNCPKCACQDEHYIDLEQEMLTILGQLQQQQLRDIHSIAKVYHWKEDDIMSLPKWRQQRYLTMIESEQSTR